MSGGADDRKLQRLRVMVKLMLGMGVMAVFYVALSSGFSGTAKLPDVPSMKVNISDIKPGQMKQLLWENRPIIILHRNAQQVASLGAMTHLLRDPQSLQSLQPENADNQFRSISARWFVVLASGTDLGCSLDYLPEYALQPDAENSGAFRDTCRESLYDLAGRVLQNQSAEKNLTVPHYQLHGEYVLLGVSDLAISQ